MKVNIMEEAFSKENEILKKMEMLVMKNSVDQV
jgi:hypothetical protein